MILYKHFPQKITRVIFTLLLFILPLCPVAAQENAVEEPGSWKYLVTGDNVYDLAVSGGHLWQGTSGGLLLRSLSAPQIYRHYHQQNSGLGSNQVLAVAPDDKGGVWMGTDSGAFYRDPSGRWTHYHSGNSPLAAGAVGVICVDGQGGAWFGTWGGGVSYLGADKLWKNYNMKNSALPGNRIYAAAIDGQGGVWFGVDGQGAAHLGKDGSWRTFNASGSDLPVNDVPDIVVDSRGSVWFATYQGLACLGSDGRWQVFTEENSGLPADQIFALALAEDGALWVAAGNGVACIKEGQVVHSYTEANSKLPGEVVKSLDIDGAGRVWAGTWGGGAACLIPGEGTWAVYDYKTTEMPGKTVLPSNNVNTILPGGAEGDEVVWFGTDRGAASLSLKDAVWGKILPLAMQNGGEPAQVRQIRQSPGGGVALALDGGGLAIMDKAASGKRYYEDSSDLPSNDVVDAAFDDEGGLWVATMGGGAAYLSASGKWTVFNTTNSGISSDYVNCVLSSPGGKIWFGTWEGGACVYDPAAKTWQVYNTAGSSLPLNDVRCLAGGSDGAIWFGTWGAGLARLDSSGKWSLYNAKNGLPSDIIRSLVPDTSGRIWVATPAGAACLSGNAWRVFRSGDSGLPTDDLRQLACDQSGRIWFSTAESGVAVYNPLGPANDLQKLTVPAQKTEEIMLSLNGKILQPDVPPIMQNARVLVPLRVISESLGAEINWDSSSGKIEVELGGKKLGLTLGSAKVFVDGVTGKLDVPPTVVDGRTLLPLRFIGESLGLDVHWDGTVQSVSMGRGQ